MDNLGKPQKTQNFFCEKCNFITSNKKDYNRHILTSKHYRRINGITIDEGFTPKCPKKPINVKNNLTTHTCICGKNYKYNQGLWKHQKTCSFKNEASKSVDVVPASESEIKILTNLILDVVKQNQELTNKIVDICRINQPTMASTITNSNVNSNNKTFNLQFFLNETCKNAMNMTQFVDSLQLQLSDLEDVGKLGYVEGISNIIVKNLNALDITQRPIHCADKKREVIYIKDEDKWEKEDAEKNKMKQLIKKVAYKNERLLPKYKELHPGCNYSESKYADHYSKLVIEAMGGAGNNDAEKEEKIMRKIAKEVVIDKSFGITD